MWLPEKPLDIPVNPPQVYKNKGWISWGDWLGTGRIYDGYQEFMPYEDAKRFVHSLGLKSETEWRKYKKGLMQDNPPLPKDVPKAPETVYKNSGWRSMGDWLGTGTIAHSDITFLPFVKARKLVRLLNLKSSTDWRKYCSGKLIGYDPKPIDIPSHPHIIYKNKGWKGIGDWLGTGSYQPGSIDYLDYNSARKIVRRLKLKSNREWRHYSKTERPARIPANPDRVYPEWISWGDWLGTNIVSTIKRDYLTFENSRDIVRSLKLGSVYEWNNHYDNNQDFFLT